MKLLIAGGTGFLGEALVREFESDDVTILTRRPRPGPYVSDLAEVEHADAVINLAGESVQGRWTHAKKGRILHSRIDTTQRLTQWVIERRPQVFLSSSAVGIYGDRGEEELPEGADRVKADGFLAKVCRDWEQAAAPAAWKGTRTILLRTGIPLDPGGGAFGQMLPLMRRFPVVSLGHKGAYMPWISLRDWVRLVRFALENKSVAGPLNLAAPNPVTQREFAAQVARHLRKRVWGHVPPWALRLALGEFAEALLASERVIPARALELGFAFDQPTLNSYLATI